MAIDSLISEKVKRAFLAAAPPEQREELEDVFRHPITDDDEFTRLQQSWEEKAQGSLNEQDGVDCERCHNTGRLSQLVQEEDPVTGAHWWRRSYRECECMARRRAARAANASGIEKKSLDKMTFENFSADTQPLFHAKRAAVAYAKDPNAGWFFISGKPGTGKTHLCTAICNRLLFQGKDLKSYDWGSICQQYSAELYGNDRSAAGYNTLMTGIRSPEIVYIDDFLKVPGRNGWHDAINGTEKKAAYDVIDTRYRIGRRMILSSELSIDEIARADEATARRIRERTGEKYLISI